MNRMAIVLSGILLAGCGPAASSSSSSSDASAGDSAKIPHPGMAGEPPPAVAPDAYRDAPQAVKALSEAADEGDRDELNRADAWLAMQGASAVEPLAAVLKDEQASVKARIAVCRALGRLGPPAKPALIEAIGGDEQMVRLNAARGLGAIRPPDQQVVQALIGLLRHDDLRTRQIAIQSLGSIGEPAKDAVPALVETLNSPGDEVLRREAKKALEKIDPRRGLIFE